VYSALYGLGQLSLHAAVCCINRKEAFLFCKIAFGRRLLKADHDRVLQKNSIALRFPEIAVQFFQFALCRRTEQAPLLGVRSSMPPHAADQERSRKRRRTEACRMALEVEPRRGEAGGWCALSAKNVQRMTLRNPYVLVAAHVMDPIACENVCWPKSNILVEHFITGKIKH